MERPANMKVGPYPSQRLEDPTLGMVSDPDLWNNTAPATQPKPAGPSIMCASPGRHLFTWSKDEGVRLTWRSNASAFNAFAPEAEVRVRVGPAVKYSDDVLMIYRLSEDASVASTSLVSGGPQGPHVWGPVRTGTVLGVRDHPPVDPILVRQTRSPVLHLQQAQVEPLRGRIAYELGHSAGHSHPWGPQ